VVSSTEAPGANCSAGGLKLESGIDVDGDGVLNPTEAGTPSYVCDGVDSLSANVAEAAGANCVNGGRKLTSGADLDGSGTLDAGEVTSTSYVCNGLASLVELATEAAGPNCANGGTAVTSGLDANGNGVLDPAEAGTPTYICIPNGGGSSAPLAIVVTPVPMGTDCPNAGNRLDWGPDVDSNGLPDTTTGTQLLCNANPKFTITNGQLVNEKYSLSGWAYNYSDGYTVFNPICGAPGQPCYTTQSGALCTSGTVAAVVGGQWGTYWGGGVGFAINQATASSPTLPTFLGGSGIAFDASGTITGNPDVRIQVEVMDGGIQRSFCSVLGPLASSSVSWTSLTENCWTGGGVTFDPATMQVSNINLQFVTDYATHTLTNVCFSNFRIVE
jgi:hypothetical protein